jgi:hypothetical protein
MFYAKYLSSSSFCFLHEDFSRFFQKIFRLPKQPEFFMQFNSLNNFELHARNISAKFQQILPSGLGGEVD